jgi:uncharacterized membrane protein
MLNQMKNNSAYWRGPFYYNPHDPRIFVPKPNRFPGCTMNLANPKTYLFFIVLLIYFTALKFI